MQIQAEQLETSPFEIVYNARSNKASKSRKTSISINESARVKAKAKKLRKMTLNPQSVTFEEIKEIEENHERNAVKSLKEQKMQEEDDEFDFARFLELGPKKLQSEQEIQLQNGITYGIGSEQDLDNDFNWSWMKEPALIELVDISNMNDI